MNNQGWGKNRLRYGVGIGCVCRVGKYVLTKNNISRYENMFIVYVKENMTFYPMFVTKINAFTR